MSAPKRTAWEVKHKQLKAELEASIRLEANGKAPKRQPTTIGEELDLNPFLNGAALPR